MVNGTPALDRQFVVPREHRISDRALMALSAVMLIVLVSGAATAVAATDAPSIPPRNRLGVSVGLASAVGAVGVTYDVAVSRFFRVEAGVGWGFSGLQLAAMPKIAIGGDACAYVLGFGAAVALGGPSAEQGHGPAPSTIPWLNFDALGVECHTRAGFSVSGALGLTMPRRAFHWDFAELGDTIKAGSVLPQGRVGVGWWF